MNLQPAQRGEVDDLAWMLFSGEHVGETLPGLQGPIPPPVDFLFEEFYQPGGRPRRGPRGNRTHDRAIALAFSRHGPGPWPVLKALRSEGWSIPVSRVYSRVRFLAGIDRPIRDLALAWAIQHPEVVDPPPASQEFARRTLDLACA